MEKKKEAKKSKEKPEVQKFEYQIRFSPLSRDRRTDDGPMPTSHIPHPTNRDRKIKGERSEETPLERVEWN